MNWRKYLNQFGEKLIIFAENPRIEVHSSSTGEGFSLRVQHAPLSIFLYLIDVFKGSQIYQGSYVPYLPYICISVFI